MVSNNKTSEIYESSGAALTWESAQSTYLDAHFAVDMHMDLLVNWKVTFHDPPPPLEPLEGGKDKSDYTNHMMSGGERWSLKNQGWGIDKHCSDFYLLLLSSICSPDDKTRLKYKGYLDKKSEILAEQFASYTDMAVGGELRHTSTKMLAGVPKPLLNALRNKTIGRNVDGVSRSSAWIGWYHFRQQYGTLALRWAVKVFNNGKWGNAYGGDKWGAIANTLLMYETGDLPRLSFVDTCFGLQHNGGIYFNKWWDRKLYELHQVMNANLEGRYCYLYRHTSSNVQRLLNKEEIMKQCQCSDHGNGS